MPEPHSARKNFRRRFRPLRHALTEGLLRLLRRICPILTHGGALVFGRALGRAAYFACGKERATAARNLAAAFGPDLSPAETRRIVRGVFASAGMAAAETLHAARWGPGDFARTIRVEGEEHWRAAAADGRGVVFVSGHLGNWELMAPAFVHQSGLRVCAVVRPTRNEVLNSMIRDLRTRPGIEVLETGAPLTAFIRRLRRGEVLALLADQDSRRHRGIFVPFFGRPALTPAGAAFLARRTGAPVVCPFIRRSAEDPRRHVMSFHPPLRADPALPEEDDVRRITAAAAALLEEQVRAFPDQWAWTHDRWRHRPKAPRTRHGGESKKKP